MTPAAQAGIDRLDEQRADHHVRAARLVDDGRAEVVELVAEDGAAFGERPRPRSGPPAMTTRVGSPPVCESITVTRSTDSAFIVRLRLAATSAARRSPGRMMAEHALALRPDQRQARRANHLTAEPAFLSGQLDVLDELDVRVQMQQRRVPAIDARPRPNRRPPRGPTAAGSRPETR